MVWELKQIKHTEWLQDKSGYYTLINWIDKNNVRLDIMNRDDMPVVSFQGKANDVRKHIMQHIDSRWSLSLEHASYIGAELTKAAILKNKYIQD